MKQRNRRQSKDLRIPVLSLFTGGGFLDMGFEKAGFETVWTNELNPVFADMYSYGMTLWRKSLNSNAEPKTISELRSIENIFAPEIIRSAFSNGRPDFFGIIGGPPCPDFSLGGKNRGAKGANGRLSGVYINRICKILPAFFVFENVPGLYRTKIHRDFLSKFEKKLERCNYCLDLKILNALEFGVPQDRERLFMIGIQRKYVNQILGRKIKHSERGWFPWPNSKKYVNAKTRFSWPGIVNNGEKPSIPDDIPLELTVYRVFSCGKNSPIHLKNGKDVFKVYSSKFKTIREGDAKRKSFKRLHRYRFSPTVCYGHNEVHLHPWQKRRLSVREAMRIQGIPDSFALPAKSSLTAKFLLVSNGVPVPLAYEVAVSLREFFKVFTQKRNKA
jgi:DNA (cytosine-5)-methyltransferase 1